MNTIKFSSLKPPLEEVLKIGTYEDDGFKVCMQHADQLLGFEPIHQKLKNN